jgi:hypothetical protein
LKAPEFSTPDEMVTFVVALKIKNEKQLKKEFMEISNPKSKSYGNYLTLYEIDEKFGLSANDKQKVIAFFSSIKNTIVKEATHGDMLQITGKINSIEDAMHTKLSWRVDSRKMISKRSLRADLPLQVPPEIASLISFISLNCPINHAMPKVLKVSSRSQVKAKDRQEIEIDAREEKVESTIATASNIVGVTNGNEEALINFKPYCGDGSLNKYNPPCSGLSAELVPTFKLTATFHANNKTDPYLLTTDPIVFNVPAADVYCYNTSTKTSCDGGDGKFCSCLAKVK